MKGKEIFEAKVKEMKFKTTRLIVKAGKKEIHVWGSQDNLPLATGNVPKTVLKASKAGEVRITYMHSSSKTNSGGHGGIILDFDYGDFPNYKEIQAAYDKHIANVDDPDMNEVMRIENMVTAELNKIITSFAYKK